MCGPSGCGKSTLLTLIAGWERPQRGKVTSAGVNSVVWVFQNPHGVPHRTALDHVAFPFLAKGDSRRVASQKGLEVMQRFGLEPVAWRPFSALSGGEAQRLMLARALAVGPDVLLVDEPTAQLDRHAAASVNDNLRLVASSGAIVVVATHDPGTRRVCDSLIDLGAGTGVVGSRS
ncbi:MAG: ATP-binding cassette domain-containing protein [Propionibacteriaceae bacterium]|nr:ATP-binding cassette domain-containing protein [Propionibacteriaceae bacterium]